MMTKLKELIRFARISIAGKDDAQFPVQQVDFMENAADAFLIFPYGMHANAAVDALSVLFSVNGDEQSLAAIATSAKDRIKNLESGEVIFFHPKTKSFTKYANNGDIDIETESKVNVKASEVIIDAPVANFTGIVTCASLNAATSLVVNGVEMSNHTHAAGGYNIGGTSVTGNSGSPN